MALDIINNTLYTQLMANVDMRTDHFGTTPIQGLTCYAVQSVWKDFNSDSNARIITSGSNDGITYTQIDSITPTGTTGSYLLNVEKAGYRFVKVAYTQRSGVGTLNTTISGKII